MTDIDIKILEFIEEVQSQTLNDFANGNIDSDGMQHINVMIDRFQTDYELLSSYLNPNTNKNKKENHDG